MNRLRLIPQLLHISCISTYQTNSSCFRRSFDTLDDIYISPFSPLLAEFHFFDDRSMCLSSKRLQHSGAFFCSIPFSMSSMAKSKMMEGSYYISLSATLLRYNILRRPLTNAISENPPQSYNISQDKTWNILRYTIRDSRCLTLTP